MRREVEDRAEKAGGEDVDGKWERLTAKRETPGQRVDRKAAARERGAWLLVSGEDDRIVLGILGSVQGVCDRSQRCDAGSGAHDVPV